MWNGNTVMLKILFIGKEEAHLGSTKNLLLTVSLLLELEF